MIAPTGAASASASSPPQKLRSPKKVPRRRGEMTLLTISYHGTPLQPAENEYSVKKTKKSTSSTTG